MGGDAVASGGAAPRRVPALAFWIPLAVLVAGYALMLDRHGYWYDELMTVLAARRPFAEMVEERLRAGHPPGYFALAWAWRRIAGEGEVAMRLPSLLFALASAAILHDVVRRMADPQVARLAVLLLLLSPFQLEIAHVARPYALFQLLALSLTALVVRAGDGAPRRGDPLRAGALAFGLLAVHYSALLVLPGWGIYLLARRPRRPGLALGLALGALAAAPFALATRRLRSATGAIEWLGAFAPSSVLRILAEPAANVVWLVDAPASGLAIAAVLVSLAAVGALATGRRSVPVGVGWLAPFAAAIVAGLAGAPNLVGMSRYFVGPLAHEVGLVAAGLGALFARRRAVGVLATAAVAGVALAASGQNARDDHGVDWRALSRTVAESRRPGEPIAVGISSLRWQLWRYYVPTPTYDLFRLGRGPHPNPMAGTVAAHALHPRDVPARLEEAPSVLLYHWLPLYDSAIDGRAALAEHFPHETAIPVRHGTLLRLSRKVDSGGRSSRSTNSPTQGPTDAPR